ncbi:putative f-box and wd domain-containing protein [Golovinomyces cichoracearum]|uniref:Putative f-box and wd domain-containing protein n=1 Tax=Golovinomyces cichoracearum TaxID=62708 RepID=A0A420IP12_9PEZI|nr:putative f-box and wd domain-containing protein [Golovinomyces cichoracearum]
MQSKPIKTSHNTSNISLPHQLANFNHGNFNQKLKSDNLLLSFEEESCRSKYLEALYDDDGSCSENAILQTQPNDILQDTEIISNSSSIPTKPEHESLILTYLEESNENFEASKETKSQSRQNGAATLSEVPNEILTQILSFPPESSIITTSLVSKRFNKLVTTSHVWRTAFFRAFRGPCIHRKVEKDLLHTPENREEYNTELLLFNRLSRQGSWRREYILRTRLLRSLGRGKPAQNKSNKENVSTRKSDAKNINPVITYNSHLSAPISHIHAKFDNGTKPPSIIHGSNELSSVTISDPTNGKIGKWRASELSGMFPSTDAWTDQLPYGMGDGPVLIPNSMDVSQLHGVIFGEGIPGGKTYYQSSNELRGRFLTQASDFTDLENGIPKIPEIIDGVSAVWIAKSHSVPSMTDELIGMLRGSTMGIVSAYATGLETHANCISKGLVTAKWVLSPGVPIIAFDVDDSYNAERKACGRVWAVALNALGEVFYLNQTPSHVSLETTSEVNKLERLAWSVGRTVHWHMISVSRRIARSISNRELENNLGYSPRSSSNDLNLSKAQIRDETMEIESFFRYPPAHFRKIYESWDMRRRLHVDFAGDDSNGAGEAIVVIKCGDSSGHGAEVRRMTRIGRKRKFFERDNICQESGPHLPTETIAYSIDQSMDAPQDLPLKDTSFLTFSDINPLHKRDKNSNSGFSSSSFRIGGRSEEGKLHEEWQNTIFTMKDHFKSQITCSAIDMSTFALLTINEDPLSTCNNELLDETSKKVMGKSSPFPGYRARFLVVGTKIGSLIIWNMRGPRSSDVSIVNELHPVRKIFTDSPEISCIAVTALYIVHGGNDGLVQAWNTLASASQPVRTLHSRFSSKFRRRLPQNVADPFDLGANFKAAGAIMLDPDPTRLRGIVSIGSQLRYWSYSSSASDEFPRKRHRRQLLDRGMSVKSDRFSSSGRGAIRDHITTEHEDLKKEEIWKSNQTKHLSNRFGVGMFGLTEEEAILYAELVSAEDFEKKSDQRRWTDSQSVGSNEASESLFPRNIPIIFDSQDACTTLDDYEQQISEAIRLSLLESKSEQEKL